MNTIRRAGVVSLIALALAGLPAQLAAQSTNSPAAGKKAAAEKQDTAKAEKKKAPHPFHGKLAKVDKIAKTIKVGESVYQITSETRIKKSGKPATLDDGVEGEEVTGYVKPDASGKLAASSVNFGVPAGKKSSSKSADKTSDTKPDKK